jgi:glycosyltransferase involved in cell wall biosynthesis
MGRVQSEAALKDDICILLALYNGAGYLRDQLNSFDKQSYKNWTLLVSDDGSTDAGPGIVNSFARKHRHGQVRLVSGPRQGFVQNFFHLLRSAPADAAMVALSDQDDVWFSDKLTRAKAALDLAGPHQPALYCARTTVCTETLTPTGDSSLFLEPPSFQNALVQNLGGGNTMVLNRAALEIVQHALAGGRDAVSHDWWLYQLMTGCGATVLYDQKPVLLYRQHRHNVNGANCGFRARVERATSLMNGRFRRWNDLNQQALMRSANQFTSEARRSLMNYSEARNGRLISRLRHLYTSGARRQDRLGTAALYAACLIGKL